VKDTETLYRIRDFLVTISSRREMRMCEKAIQ